jgi:diaminohydroxyphosphoribosylaminopyrimidine deaminase/5-amino-6-(5-phosphoribosylamino)uracil reductase
VTDREADPNDLRHVRRAIELAARGPVADANPRVGAVVTDRTGLVVGEGWHHGAGSPHAEIEALRAAGAAAEGGTVHVSLEPCDHTGRTGPCTAALIAAGVARVVFALADPNPPAAGGADRLRAAGIQVTGNLLPEEALALNRSWVHRVRTGRPFVTWKFATTLDGRSAAADGSSRWITGGPARADVHALRSTCGAVIAGTGTVLADDPQLTARGPDGPLARQPVRVVIGERPIPPRARVLDDAAPTLVFPTRNLAEVLTGLARAGIHHALLEGGPTLAAAFLRAGFVDEVVAYVAPALLGAGPSAVAGLGVTSIADIVRLTPTSVTVVGADVRITATPHRFDQEGH